ncbi:MAG: hypothetical protein DME21_08550 [Verrucomicrobia bacterium]|nr:MAG: hypothetical protein DME21_08550 [Verrucomicrobiota bacterium]
MKPLLIFLVAWLGLPAVLAQATDMLKLTKTIPLADVKGRFDHFAPDVEGKRLFVAALGNNTLEVIDLAACKRLRSISGLYKPTGTVFLPEANQIGVANGDDGTFKLFDGITYQLVNNLRGLEDADNVRRDRNTKLVYVGYGGGALVVLDGSGRQRHADIKLPAHPESFQLETNGPRIFVNVPDAKQVAVIDRQKKDLVATWSMEKFQANFPMALDEGNHRLFVGCRNPARLVVLDTTSGKVVSDLVIVRDTDDLFYDAKRKRIYVSGGEGSIDVIEQLDADHYKMRERIPTRAGARTSFFSAELNEFYLAVPQRNGQDAEIRIYHPE